MSDNVLQTLQKLVQDVIAPDVRETKVRLEALSKETDTNSAAMQKQIDFRLGALKNQLSSTEKTILAAIGQLKAQSELNTMSAVADLRERIAVLESQRGFQRTA